MFRLAAALARRDLVGPSPCSAELERLGQQQPSVVSALQSCARLQRNAVAFAVADLGHAPVARIGGSEAQLGARLQCSLQARIQVIDADVDARPLFGRPGCVTRCIEHPPITPRGHTP